MAINTTITADCNKAIITITDSDASVTNEVRITSLNTGNSYTYAFPGGASNVRITDLLVDIGTNEGIFTVEHLVNGSTYIKTAFLAACDVLCCLAKKMEELLDCDCDCTKCSKHLADAQKIYLLLKTAESELATADTAGSTSLSDAVIANAHKKYMTAQDMCSGHCGCNC